MTDPTMLPGRTKALTLVGAMLGMLLAALDQTIVATAGPTIQKSLAIAPSLYTWITTSYLVASTVLVPIWGKLSDMYGRRRMLLAGIAVFLTGSVLCGVSQTATQLILFRALQGMGSASLFTSAIAVIADLFAPAERGKYQGIFGAVFGLSSVVGPLVGGFITDNIGWHWCFFINLPVGAVAVAFIVLRMPALRPRVERAVTLDLLGVVTLAVAVVPLLLALSLGRATLQPGETGYLWTSWQTGALFGTSLVGLVLFLMAEGRARDAIIDLKLFSNRAFAIGNAASFIAGMPFLGAIVFLPLFMVNVVGASATSSGLTTVPLTFGIVAGNIVSGQLVSRTGRYKPFILAAMAILTVAFALMAFTLSPSTTRFEAGWKMFIVGVGLGPGIPLYTLVVQNAVPPQVIGAATSVATFFRQMGATVGLAILGSVFATTLSSAIETRMAEATKGLPPALVEQLKQRGAGPNDEGDGASRAAVAFDKEQVKARMHAAFAARPQTPEAARTEQMAFATVDRVDAALKEAFAEAIARVYLVGIFIALLGLLASTTLPVLPLRGRAQHGPPPAME